MQDYCCEIVEENSDGHCCAHTYYDYDKCAFHKIKELEQRLAEAIDYIKETCEGYHLHADFCKFTAGSFEIECTCGACDWTRNRNKFIKENSR